MSVASEDVRAAALKHMTATGTMPHRLGLHPADFDALSLTHVPAGVDLVVMWGMFVVPCPDTEPGTVEVLK